MELRLWDRSYGSTFIANCLSYPFSNAVSSTNLSSMDYFSCTHRLADTFPVDQTIHLFFSAICLSIFASYCRNTSDISPYTFSRFESFSCCCDHTALVNQQI